MQREGWGGTVLGMGVAKVMGVTSKSGGHLKNMVGSSVVYHLSSEVRRQRLFSPCIPNYHVKLLVFRFRGN